jgi:peptidoglycan biosynthesis protein MviN/MurJ (putative lipid II flippase)
MPTTIAAFVSLGQYIIGLKKRGYWQFEKPLLVKMLKIALVSIVMGAGVHEYLQVVQFYFPQYLTGYLYTFVVLGGAGIFALAIFLTLAKICGVIDIWQIIRTGRQKYGKKSA